MKPPMIVLAGPTAVGKTELSLKLAEALNAEIVSADSMQVYRGMDIGTAKATEAERRRVPHHLIDVADPSEDFSIARYVELGRGAIRDILTRGRLPLIVGGTGFYIQALLKDLDFSEEKEEDTLRKKYQKLAETEGAKMLHRRLQAIDPASAAAIHPNNVKRVIRALEYFEKTGKPISSLNEAQTGQESPYRVLYFVLNLPRPKLYRRIEKRVDQMIEEGLLEETGRLLKKGIPSDSTAMQSIGYKELAEYLRGECNEEEAVQKIKLNSRHYAKRQITWFKREKEAIWIEKEDYSDEDELFEHLLTNIRLFLNTDHTEAATGP